MTQLILHLLGDYVTQSDWMAQNKTKSTYAALLHATTYSIPFALIASLNALLVIWITHFFIDRYRLARYVVYAKNILFQPGLIAAVWKWRDVEDRYAVYSHEVAQVNLKNRWKWTNCATTGYPSDSPAWMAVWLLIAADNTLHLAINYIAISFL